MLYYILLGLNLLTVVVLGWLIARLLAIKLFGYDTIPFLHHRPEEPRNNDTNVNSIDTNVNSINNNLSSTHKEGDTMASILQRLGSSVTDFRHLRKRVKDGDLVTLQEECNKLKDLIDKEMNVRIKRLNTERGMTHGR